MKNWVLKNDAKIFRSSHRQNGDGMDHQVLDNRGTFSEKEGSGRMTFHGRDIRISEMSNVAFDFRTGRREDIYGYPPQFLEDDRLHNYNYSQHHRHDDSDGFNNLESNREHLVSSFHHRETIKKQNHNDTRVAEWEESMEQQLPCMANDVARNSSENLSEVLIDSNYADKSRYVPFASHRNDLHMRGVKRFCRKKGIAPWNYCNCEYCRHERYLTEAPLEQERLLLQNTFGRKKLGYQDSPFIEETSYRDAPDHVNHHQLKFAPFCSSEEVRLRGDFDMHTTSSGNVSRATNSDSPASSLGIPRRKYPNSDGMPFLTSHGPSTQKGDFIQGNSLDFHDRGPLANITTKADIRAMRSDHHMSDRVCRNAFKTYLEFEPPNSSNKDSVYAPIGSCSKLEYKCISRGHRIENSPIIGEVDNNHEEYDHTPFHRVRMTDAPMHCSPWNKGAAESYDGQQTIQRLKRKVDHASFSINPGIRQFENDQNFDDDHLFHQTQLYPKFRGDVSPRCSSDRLPEMPIYKELERPRICIKRSRMDERHVPRRTSNVLNGENYMLGEEDFNFEDNRPNNRIDFARDTFSLGEIENSHNMWVDDVLVGSRIRKNYMRDSFQYSPVYHVTDNEDSETEALFHSRDPALCHRRESRLLSREDSYPTSKRLESIQLGHMHTRESNITQNTNVCIDDLDSENGYPSKDRKSDLNEGSDEFRLKVEEEFYKNSKKLSINLSTCRRYKEEGKAGSLFCIVCGRSSKEFLTTQRLAIHAFMSPKVGLRVKHLGLWKAICVLMGWNVQVPLNSVTWTPEVLPDSIACAQKDDIILWPPIVVICNISMSSKLSMHRKVVSHEKITSFLRGKGLIEGKLVCTLGHPADRSIILLKFLGTFTGLGTADKVHNYFSENNRGRLACQQILDNVKRIDSDASDKGESFEDLLYGYLGTASDLTILDQRTKNQIHLKSKASIQHFANEPVRSNVD